MANTKITSRVLADNAVLTANITDANVTTAKVADNAVTGDKVADDVALAGNPTTTTQSAGNNTTRIATTAFVTTAVANLADSAPDALNTLNELAAAMGDDANFSTTITNSIAAKLPLAGGTLTGALTGTTGAFVKASSGGSATSNTVLTIEDDDNTEISILGGSSSVLAINFGHSGDNDEGKITFNTTAGSEDLQIVSSKLITLDGSYVTVQGQASYAQIALVGNDGVADGYVYAESGDVGFLDDDGHWAYKHDTDTSHQFLINNDVKMHINSDGKVGINETSPQAWLDIGTTHGVAKEVALRITNADYPNYGWEIWRDNTTGHLNFAHEDAGTDSTRVTFEAGGSVGIGTTDPDALLEIVSSDPRIRLRDDTAGGGAGNGGQIEFVGYHANASDGKREFARIKGLKENSTGGDTDGYLSLLVNQSGTLTESMRLESNGLVGIATDTPGAILDVRSPANSYWCFRANTVDSDYGVQSRGQGSYAYACLDSSSNSYRGRWQYNGTLYTQDGNVHDIDSDERLKEEITDCPSQWSLIKDLPLQRFKWKDRRNGDTFSYGWIAQPTKAKYPEFVEPIPQSKEDIDEGKEDPEYLTVKSGDIQKRSIAALQEAMARIEALEAEVAALKG